MPCWWLFPPLGSPLLRPEAILVGRGKRPKVPAPDKPESLGTIPSHTAIDYLNGLPAGSFAAQVELDTNASVFGSGSGLYGRELTFTLLLSETPFRFPFGMSGE